MEKVNRIRSSIGVEWCVVLVVFVALTAVAFYPISVLPDRLSLAHRTASSHAVEMFHFGRYFDLSGGMPVCYLRIWAFPEGGIAKPLAIPSLAVGWVLCKVMSPRVAFNIVFMLNLLAGAMSFYLVGRRIGLRAPMSAVFGALVVFHPCLQSFILRGQLENVMLWPVGFSILSLAWLLTTERHRLAAFAACLLLPVLQLYSTPYYALFYMILWPIMLAFLVLRLGVSLFSNGFRWAVASGVVLAVVLPFLVQFYRPGVETELRMVNLNPGTLEAGLAAATPTESLRDLFDPSGVLRSEKPYLGSVLLLGLALAAVLAVWRKFTGRRREASAVPADRHQLIGTLMLAAGTFLFGLLSLGRQFGVEGGWVLTLPAAWIDRVYPGFQNVVKLFRILPFLAICGGLIVADALNRLRPGLQHVVAGVVIFGVLVEGLITAPLSERVRSRYYIDSERSLPGVIRDLPRFDSADAPVLDLPPPVGSDGRVLWGLYTYYQTEHGQRLVWFDGCPPTKDGIRGRIIDAYQDPQALISDKVRRQAFAGDLAKQGIALVVVHKFYLVPEKLTAVAALFDSEFDRLAEDEDAIAWRVQLRSPAPVVRGAKSDPP